MTQAINPEGRAAVETFKGEKGKKLLKVSTDTTTFQKEYFRSFREKIAQGEPVVWKYVGTPPELFRSMDIIDYDMQHYSALCSAKQLSDYYLDKLNTEGYFRDLCRYCTVPLGYAFDKNNEIAPWGGLPKFTAAVFIHQDDPALKIWELYARELNVPMYVIERPYWGNVPDFEHGWGEWDREGGIEPHRADLMVEEFEGLIRFLETVTGKHFSITKLRQVMDRSNQMYYWYGAATNLACEAVPCPISWTDALSNVPVRVFHLGSEIGVKLAKQYYGEIKERVDQGLEACDNEKVRLRYYGHPVWFSLGFYNTWENRYGAIFLPTYYFEGAEFGIMPNLNDPLRALAIQNARGMGIQRIPTTFLTKWHVHLSQRYKANGVLLMLVESCKLLYASVLWSKAALEKAGFPTLEINADMVDARDWDDTKMKAMVTSFIETIMP